MYPVTLSKGLDQHALVRSNQVIAPAKDGIQNVKLVFFLFFFLHHNSFEYSKMFGAKIGKHFSYTL